MQHIADWLDKLGMSEYAQRFAENRIDFSVLPDLTDQHLKDLGIALGDRLKMLRAIRDLGNASVAVTEPSAPAAAEPTRKDDAERRQLTVMFCDLVGSTALSAKLDPEDLRTVIGAYHRCCTELVERNGGFVAKFMGDGILAYFGYPQAHEHDAERAVRAGLAVVEAVPKLETAGGVPLQVRVGIATGLVVVGDLVGSGAAQEQAVVGETPNLAARLQALAEPGVVVIGSSTRRLTGGLFEYRDLGTVALKGFAENVPAWQVLGEGAAESRFEALRATTTPLTPALRVLVVITFRPEFTPPWLGLPQVTLLSLNRLPPRRGAEMIARLTGGKALPKEIAHQIIDRTDGVPLFIEELTKAVVESGVLTDAGDRYTVAGALPPLAIPATLNASLLARLDRLAPVREVAQIGAALGRQFSHELISAVAPMPQQQLDDALAQLVSAELIFRRGSPPDAEYAFKHALVQDAAYSTLLRSRRQQLHVRIAATLEDYFPEIVVAQPALLAQHCAEAGLAEKAVVYWLKAGRQALARSAMTEAVAQLQKGLDVLAGLPDGPWRREQELDLQFALRPALAATKGYAAPDVGETIARARALAEQLDRPEHLVRLIVSQWGFHLIRSEHRLAVSLAEQIEKIGEARNDVRVQLRGRRANGWTRFYLGEFVAARALLERCHGLADPAHRAVGAGSEDPYASMLASLAVTLVYLGYIDQARSRVNEALSEARRLRQAHRLAEVLQCAIWIEFITYSPEMHRPAEELLALSTEHGFPLYLGWAIAFRGVSFTALGQVREGLTLLTQGLAAVRATGCVAQTAYALMRLAEAYATLGQPVEGLNYLAEAAQIIETTEERMGEAELHRLRGDLLNATGDRAAAEQSYHQALAVAERQSAKLFELRAATSLARLWRDKGKRTEARDLLAPIYGWFTEGFDTPVLQDAKALLDELNA